ncbi:MAG: hypothetical protein ABJB66_12800 [Gemmatimonadaceae bacterium]
MSKLGLCRQALIAAGIGALTMLQACGDCVSIGVSGIAVTVIDAATHNAPESVPSLRVTDGAYVEIQTKPSSQAELPVLYAASEREGVYQVLVSAQGYRDFSVDGVRVSRESGSCRALKTVKITASLERIQR